MRYQFDLLEQTVADQVAESAVADLLWCNSRLSVAIFQFVDTRDFTTFCCSCLLFYCDHSVIAFSLTEHRLGIRGLLDWEVPSHELRLWNSPTITMGDSQQNCNPDGGVVSLDEVGQMTDGQIFGDLEDVQLQPLILGASIGAGIADLDFEPFEPPMSGYSEVGESEPPIPSGGNVDADVLATQIDEQEREVNFDHVSTQETYNIGAHKCQCFHSFG